MSTTPRELFNNNSAAGYRDYLTLTNGFLINAAQTDGTKGLQVNLEPEWITVGIQALRPGMTTYSLKRDGVHELAWTLDRWLRGTR